MNRRTLASIGLLLAAVGAYVLIGELRRDSPPPTTAPDGAHVAPQATPPPLPTPQPPTLSGGGAAPPPAPPTPSPATAGTPPLPALSPDERATLEHVLVLAKAGLVRQKEMHAEGHVGASQVAEAELAVLDARKALGEIDVVPYHRARADLLAQLAEHVARRALAGSVAQEDADAAKLDVARERALAGDPSDYVEARAALLASTTKRLQELLEGGFVSGDEATIRRLALAHRFPPLSTEPPRK